MPLPLPLPLVSIGAIGVRVLQKCFALGPMAPKASSGLGNLANLLGAEKCEQNSGFQYKTDSREQFLMLVSTN